MFTAIKSPYLVPFDGNFQRTDFPTCPPDDVLEKKKLKKRLKACVEDMAELHQDFYDHEH